MVYYNEIERYAAQWLRNLIDSGQIANGIVDERSIEDVHPRDLDGFSQCHFFAGIGGWSYALRRAGWADDRPVWTGSCPCQPFSAAGKGAGFADERHLWPSWHHLIQERGPAVVFGEQVASGAAGEWLDLVQDDLEGMGYAFGAVPFPAAGLGAPHIRDRLYWVADSHQRTGDQGRANIRGRLDRGDAQSWPGLGGSGVLGGLEYPGQHHATSQNQATSAWYSQADRPADISGGSGFSPGRLADLHSAGFGAGREGLQAVGYGAPAGADCGISPHGSAGPLHGLWAGADWLFCRDGKWRPVEPGTFPLADGLPARVGRLRGYGNAIVPDAAAAFIKASMTC